MLRPSAKAAILALLLGSLGAGTSWAQPMVQIERTGEAYRINVRLPVQSDRQTAWAVLTDYDNLFKFVPGMRSSRILSAPGEPKLLEQKGESGLGFVRVSTESVSRLRETPLQSIQFELVSGNLKSMRGEWSIEGHDHAVVLAYRADITPGFPLPPLIGPAVLSQNIRSMVEGVGKEIGRRTAPQAPQSKPTAGGGAER